MPAPTVTAVVVTFDRKELLLECLAALARQTRPVDRVLVVDNASTDGTPEAVAEHAPGAELLRLPRNGGGSEGFHAGVLAALDGAADWLWLMDDDCEPADDALARLLAAPGAADPAVGAVVPAVRDPHGALLPMHRGRITPRLVRAPIVAAAPDEYEQGEVALDFCSFVGPLYRRAAVERMGPPLREAFIRFEDLEFAARLRPLGLEMRLVPGAVVTHKEAIPVTGSDLRTLWADFRRGGTFGGLWKGVYGLRNVVFAGRRHGFVSGPAALSYVALQAARAALFDDRKARTVYLYALYAADGWRGRFRNVPPPDWTAAAGAGDPRARLGRYALRYDAGVGPLTTRPGPPSRATPAA